MLEVSFLYGPTVRQLDEVIYSKPSGEERSCLDIRALIIVASKINIRNSVTKARVGHVVWEKETWTPEIDKLSRQWRTAWQTRSDGLSSLLI
jgi:hypothetical protein